MTGIIAARDKLGRTPVVIGKKKNAFAVASESCSFPNTGFELTYNLGPGEVVQVTADGFEQIEKAGRKDADMFILMGILWISAFFL